MIGWVARLEVRLGGLSARAQAEVEPGGPRARQPVAPARIGSWNPNRPSLSPPGIWQLSGEIAAARRLPTPVSRAFEQELGRPRRRPGLGHMLSTTES